MYPVFTHKVDAMKKLQQLAARGGYSRYTSGIIDVKKLETLLYKFEDRYRINATKQMRYRAKQRGEANTEIVLLKQGTDIHFWLMVSIGQNPVVDLENLKDLTDKKHRLEITGYELVRVQRADKVRWTWRMTKQNYSEFEQRIRDACRHKNSDHIEQAIYSLERMPVFSEMRQQAFTLFKYLKAEYQRSHKTPLNRELRKNFYGRFKAPETLSAVKLSQKARRTIDRAKENERAAFRAEFGRLEKEIEEKEREIDQLSSEPHSELLYIAKNELSYLQHLLDEARELHDWHLL